MSVSPYLYYEDAAAALDWLARAFGFEELVRYVDADGVVREAEMAAGETTIMLNGAGPGYWRERGGGGRPAPRSSSTWTTSTPTTRARPARASRRPRRPTSPTARVSTEPPTPRGISGTSGSACATRSSSPPTGARFVHKGRFQKSRDCCRVS